MKYGALEGGGTKMVMAVADENLNILARETIPTKTPAETMPAMIEFFKNQKIDALGIGCFGPLDLKPSSPAFGSIAKTPKLAWRDYPLMAEFQKALQVPCAIDTDVNAAALCELKLGAGKGLNNCVYVTVGTGIGGGVVCEGNLVHGLMHPEWGHILLAPHPEDPMPQGACPYHVSCLEGLASGPAMEKRWGVPGRELPPDHPAWKIEAHYLAQMCVAALMMVSTEKIILGGGVMSQKQLFPMIREEVLRMLGGYLHCVDNADDLIVPPACWPDSGLLGSVLLAKMALEEKA